MVIVLDREAKNSNTYCKILDIITVGAEVCTALPHREVADVDKPT